MVPDILPEARSPWRRKKSRALCPNPGTARCMGPHPSGAIMDEGKKVEPCVPTWEPPGAWRPTLSHADKVLRLCLAQQLCKNDMIKKETRTT